MAESSTTRIVGFHATAAANFGARGGTGVSLRPCPLLDPDNVPTFDPSLFDEEEDMDILTSSSTSMAVLVVASDPLRCGSPFDALA